MLYVVGVTRDLAGFVLDTSYNSLPAEVVKEAKRDVINVLGVAIYASKDPSLSLLLGLFADEGGRERAAIWGTTTRTTLQNAALANGYLAHLEDYDDTHFPTVLHPSAPTVPAAYAVAEDAHASGRDFLAAVALGIEASCRLAYAVHPWHYDLGWHITGTFGVFGSAVASAKLLGLDIDQTVASLGIAGTQAAGVREVFGSMSKPLHAGRAAQAGLVAALLAKRGFTSTAMILEGRRGVPAVMAGTYDLNRVMDGAGQRWEIFNNGLKPYSCGVVSHPLIDACINFRKTEAIDPAAVDVIEAEVNPLVPELMGIIDPKVGLEGKFSARYCGAAGLVEGAAYPTQFTDAKVKDETLLALHRKVRFAPNAAIREDEAKVSLILKDGRRFEQYIEHATGSPENPMPDAQLNEKFLTLAAHAMPESSAKELLDRLWRLEELDDLSKLL
jgi:2-methylcitrate dehydratase PrpD